MTNLWIQRLGVCACGKQRQEDCHNAQAILGYTVRSCVYNKQSERRGEKKEERGKREEQRRRGRARRMREEKKGSEKKSQ